MTEKLHPGLGSGALREALAYIQHIVDHDHKLYCREGACVATCVNGRAVLALSLSSPIEPQAEPAYVRTCPSCGEGYNAKECDLCHVPTVAIERAVRDKENKVAQASSEIREALDVGKLAVRLAFYIWEISPVGSIGRVELASYIRKEIESALAPSRPIEPSQVTGEMLRDACVATVEEDYMSLELWNEMAKKVHCLSPTPQASSEIRERVRQERVLVLEDVIKRLWERMGNEEYGHAKAAVALDIEAVEEMKTEAERSLAVGDWTQHHLHVQPSSDCHLCRALAPSRQGADGK